MFYDLKAFYENMFEKFDQEQRLKVNSDTNNAQCLINLGLKLKVYLKFLSEQFSYFQKKYDH